MSAPAVAGVKATAAVQVAAGASGALQLFNCENEAGLAPEMETELILAVVAPAFVTVSAIAAEVVPWVVAGKASVAALSVMVGSATPVPVSVTFCGEPLALSAMERTAEKAAADAGLKATKTLQLAPAARVAPHVCSCLKSAGFVPARVIEERFADALPVLVKVTT